ncbi:MAG: hypothetical protein WC702_02620 [Patescibacteria group bacterium]|jgi:hypothetical protein
MEENKKNGLGDLKKASRSWLKNTLLLSLIIGSVATLLATLVFKEPTWKDNLLVVSSFMITSLTTFTTIMSIKLLRFDWHPVFLTRQLALKNEAIEKLTGERDRLAFAADHLIAALVQEVLLPLWRHRDEQSVYDPIAQQIGVLVLRLAERIPDHVMSSGNFIGLFENEAGLVRSIFDTATNLGVVDSASPLIKELRFWLNIAAAEEPRQPPPDDDLLSDH